MKKICLLIFAFSVLSVFSTEVDATGLKKADISSADVAKAEAEARKASQEKQQIEKQAEKVKNELEGINKKLIAAAKKIQDGEDEIRKKQDDLAELQKHLAESEAKFDLEHGMLVETLAALQNLALRPSEAVLVQPLSPVEVMRSSILLRGSARALEGRAHLIRQSIEDISQQKEKIAGRLRDIEEENTRLASQHEDMKVLSKQKSEVYSKLSNQSKEAAEKAKILAGQAHNLRDLVDKLEKQKELQRKQMAEKARLARERATEDLRASTNYGYKTETPKEITGFSKAKGKLARPARGPVVTKFHDELSKGVVSNGIDIKTASKAQVIAPFDGTVIFAGPFKNFANLLIIDHGEGYTSLLSGLAETDAQVGQMLLAGEPVGVMPSGDNVKLHMEIRKQNRPVNPSEWMLK
ncbi:MAG: peptidoglycan DD-metalloendopeptidase family protein [Alphaproteobacteria bacterium]|nr:peptidoglycan DD-metalloendopeptidase family protein [Alphaproteobacteria bacterium]